jgi:phosphate:Na+ symporter
MPDLTAATILAGGLGLFLLGMSMMTDGLKLAAGPALERVLAGATRTRWHALGSGVMVTALVQSSSAVTVATIGFVNAGLLSLGPALWVLFGANVGTTMTGWIVALVGVTFKIEALALPMIGIGVVLHLTGSGRRRGAIGTAAAGFGLLFLGISMLQESFTGLAAQVTLPQGEGALAVAAQVGVGALMTILVQSSSASIAMAITAAQGGLLTPQSAAGVVIGANVGTTVTALLAAIGATPNARRAAAAHVLFNALTGAVALALLPWLIGAIASARESLGLPSDPAAKLALFHTTFNVLGVALMWPIAGRLTRWLEQRFRAHEEDEARPRHLDDNVLAVPSLALDALGREIQRMGQVAQRMVRAALTGADAQALARDQVVIEKLDGAVEAFAERMNRSAMSPDASRRLAIALRVQRYHETTAEQARAAAALPMVPAGASRALAEAQSAFAERAGALIALCDPLAPTPAAATLDAAAAAVEQAYEPLKAELLAAGASGAVRLADMEVALRRISALRRATQQTAKAARHDRTAEDG